MIGKSYAKIAIVGFVLCLVLLLFVFFYIKMKIRKMILTYHAICDILNKNMFLPRNAYSYSSRPWKE